MTAALHPRGDSGTSAGRGGGQQAKAARRLITAEASPGQGGGGGADRSGRGGGEGGGRGGRRQGGGGGADAAGRLRQSGRRGQGKGGGAAGGGGRARAAEAEAARRGAHGHRGRAAEAAGGGGGGRSTMEARRQAVLLRWSDAARIVLAEVVGCRAGVEARRPGSSRLRRGAAGRRRRRDRRLGDLKDAARRTENLLRRDPNPKPEQPAPCSRRSSKLGDASGAEEARAALRPGRKVAARRGLHRRHRRQRLVRYAHRRTWIKGPLDDADDRGVVWEKTSTTTREAHGREHQGRNGGDSNAHRLATLPAPDLPKQ